MICFSRKLSEKYALELNLFHVLRSFSDGLDWFSFEIKSDWYKGDHNPQFGIQWIILNFEIFEFRIYNMHHVEISE